MEMLDFHYLIVIPWQRITASREYPAKQLGQISSISPPSLLDVRITAKIVFLEIPVSRQVIL